MSDFGFSFDSRFEMKKKTITLLLLVFFLPCFGISREFVVVVKKIVACLLR